MKKNIFWTDSSLSNVYVKMSFAPLDILASVLSIAVDILASVLSIAVGRPGTGSYQAPSLNPTPSPHPPPPFMHRNIKNEESFMCNGQDLLLSAIPFSCLPFLCSLKPICQY